MSKLCPPRVSEAEKFGGPSTLPGARGLLDLGEAIGDDVVQVPPNSRGTQTKLLADVRCAHRTVAQHVQKNAVPRVGLWGWGGFLPRSCPSHAYLLLLDFVCASAT